MKKISELIDLESLFSDNLVVKKVNPNKPFNAKFFDGRREKSNQQKKERCEVIRNNLILEKK